ncbi:MAG: hypothetical protein HYY60_00665 [Parcubacteria group bacterium]|nr:hypothetical protein [Parcubacteria group bacterium]MBI3075175.1 hypothetical protein [Parcubacteria group bacterium]
MRDESWFWFSVKVTETVILTVFIILISDFPTAGFWHTVLTIVVITLTLYAIWRKNARW